MTFTPGTCTCPACMASTRPNDARMCPDRGSAYRRIRIAYAWTVAMVITKGEHVCPACDGPMTVDTMEVDKVTPGNGYRPGNIVAVCGGRMGCNQQRSLLQGAGKDWEDIDGYAAMVTDASVSVSVPTVTGAKAWWNDRPMPVARRSRFA